MDKLQEKDKAPETRPDSGGLPSDEMERLRGMESADVAEELERMMEAFTEETVDVELIDAYLDVLEEKAPMPPLTKTPQEAYGELRKRMDHLLMETAEEPGPPEPPAPVSRKPRRRDWRRTFRTTATALCLILTLMVGVQAIGVDVFGYLARCTDDTLSYFFGPREPEFVTAFRETLSKNGIPPELAPSWYPEGFATEGPQVDEGNPFCVSVYMEFKDEEGREFTVSVERYFSVEDISTDTFEKDMTDAEVHTRKNRTFYILENNNTITATWLNGTFAECIEGFLTKEETLQIIDSIGG